MTGQWSWDKNNDLKKNQNPKMHIFVSQSMCNLFLGIILYRNCLLSYFILFISKITAEIFRISIYFPTLPILLGLKGGAYHIYKLINDVMMLPNLHKKNHIFFSPSQKLGPILVRQKARGAYTSMLKTTLTFS